ncbi:asparagine synthetase B [Oceanobacillus zhaokaii]|uniref:asparagine synthase (glutamine-hydrolyzing) n=1 Tax=Oceanobacillus zhaokaii TaxID=2052660 RepID=A0A345PL86_9BACI|nr:asparagine synthase-related protein [Oceanobacillus zhaokaii]AXI10766.1 asparagine synthetase B [Oceanobacillus zhaokaii]
MSAINGILHVNEEPIPIAHSQNLMHSISHYPADDVSTWQKGNVFLGCHSQWITPESLGEQLPYYDYERQLVINADAIIDNRDELFERLQVDKEQRRIMPDGKLILLAYSKWGEEAPKYLHGDFAFMIWDEKEQKLFGARDFSGARSLYFYNHNHRFAFSTTIEPLFTLPYIEKRLNETWLAEFLAIPTMVEAVDMFSTPYKSINQVPPSHRITVTKDNISLSRYMTIEVNETLKLKSNEEYEEAFRYLFQKAVKARLRTHGKVGSHLSGGLDSGTVVSFAAKELRKENKRLHTFSYIPEESFTDWTPDYYVSNESPYIKETVNYTGNILDEYLSFDGKDSLSEVDDFLDLMEMPYKFFENSFWLKGISKTASERGVKVLLNGARGNHSISWGSMTLTYNYYANLFKRLHWVQLFQELDSYCKNFRTGKSVMIPYIAKRALSSLIVKKDHSNYQFPTFINPTFAQKTSVFEKIESYGLDLSSNPTNLAEYRKDYYKQLFVWNKSGVAGSKLSLRYGLWDRDPTNDLNVIRFCLALPDEQYATGGMERSIIRRAMKGLLPNKVRMNQINRGLQGADVIHRMTSGWCSFVNELQELPNDKKLSQFINVEVIKDALSKIGREPKQEVVFTYEFKILTRSLIVNRFIKRF